MASVDELLRTAAQETVAPAASAPSAPVLAPTFTRPAPSVYLNAAISRATGAGAASATGLERDLATLSYDQIRERYGNDAADELITGLVAAGDTYRHQQTGERSTESVLSDTVSGVGLGAANAVGGIAALGAGLVSDDAGAWVAGQLGDLNRYVQGSQSVTLQNRRAAAAARNALDFRDNRAEMEREREGGGSNLLSSLRRIGRDVLDTVVNTAQEPEILADTAAQGVGSLAAAGPVGRGLAAAGRVAPTAVREGLEVLGQRTGLSATGAGIGVMEAGGAYQQTVQSILEMPFEELQRTSPRFNEMLAQGVSPEDARTQLAGDAGRTAAAVMGPVGLATGRLTQAFEAAPLRVPTVRGAAGNMLRETLEEGIQSGSGQGAQNLATRQEVNPELSLSEGVGEQIAMGAIGGLGAAGVVQAPGVTARTALNGMQAAGRAAMNAVTDRAAAVRAQNEQGSPVSDETVREAGVQAAEVAAAPETQEVLNDAIQQADVTPEVRSQMEDFARRILDVNQVGITDVNPNLPDAVQQAIGTSRSRVEMVQRLADLVNQAGPDSEIGFRAALELHRNLSRYQDLVQSDPESLAEIPETHPANALIEQFNGLADRLQQSPKVMRALETIQRTLEETLAKRQSPLAPEDAATIAEIAPDKGNLEANQQILLQASQGRVRLTQAQHQALLTSVALMSAAKKASDEAAQYGHTTRLSSVSDQIQVERGSKDPKRSATAFATRTFQLMRAGNIPMASVELAEFGKFAQHMQNKLAALNAHFEQGGAKPTYKALNPETRKWYDSSDLPTIHVISPGSLQLAQQIALEAQRIAEIYNGLSNAMPALSGGQIQVGQLNPLLQGPIREVARAFRSGERVRPGSQVQATPAPVETPAPVSTPVEAPVQEAAPKAEPKVEKKAASPRPESPPATEAVREAAPEPKEMREASKSESAGQTEAVATGGGEAEAQGTAPSVATPATPAAPSTLREAYPALIGSEDGPVKNQLHRAFRLPKEPKSRLALMAGPAEVLRQAMASESSLAKFVGASRTQRLPRETFKAYQDYLEFVPDLVAATNKRMVARLNRVNKSGDNAGKSLADQLAEGQEVNRYSSTKALNLVERQEDGSYRYNPELLETVIIAGLQWRLVANEYRSIMDEDLVNSLTGIPEELVTDDLKQMLDVGLSPVEASRSLADTIRDFWGFTDNRAASESYVKGIPQAIAGEVLNTFIEVGLIEHKAIKLNGSHGVPADPKGNAFRTVNRYVPLIVDADQPALVDPSLIEKTVLTTPPERRFYGDARPEVPGYQMRSTVVQNTAEQKAMIKAANEIPYNLNLPMFSLYETLGTDNLQRLFGSGFTDAELGERALNQNDRESLEGKNRSVAAAFQDLTGRVSEMRTFDNGKADIEKVNIHYGHNVSSVGRLQQQGAHNPQANKVVREAILPTWSEVDLRSVGGSNDHHRLFALAQAQALGIKIHALSYDAIRDKLDALLEGRLAPSLDILRSWLKGGKLGENAASILRQGLGSDLTPAALHALLEHARWQEASEEERQNFRTALYVEADGVTNGVVNGMVLLTAGAFTESQVRNLAKGGLSFDPGIATMNQYRSTEDGKKDLYEVTADTLQTLLDEQYQELGPELREQYGSMKTLFEMFLPSVRVDVESGNLVIERGATKNPLTITLYGSGANGIAGKVMLSMVKKLYERMSEAAQARKENASLSFAEAMFGTAGDPEAEYLRFRDAFNGLTRRTLSTRGGLHIMNSGAAHRSSFDPTTLTLTPVELKAMQANILHLFIHPMRVAIERTVGSSLMESASLLRDATQLQSIVLQHAFRARIDEAMEAKRKTQDYRIGDFLSQNELQTILMDLLETSPLVSTESQSFFVANSQAADIGDVTLGSDFQGRFNPPASVYGPRNSGVKGIPMLNIGMGDGMMIQGMLTNGVKGLPVFDGFNLALTDTTDGSQKANEAVFKSWQGNPLRAVLESYQVFLSNLDMGLLEGRAELRADLTRALLGDKAEVLSAEQIGAMLQAKQAELTTAANEVDARHQVIAETQVHIDQMAAAAAPYVNEGREVFGSPAAIAEALEARRNQILGTKAEKAPENAVQGLGMELASGVRVVPANAVQGLARSLVTSSIERQVLEQVLEAQSARGYQIVYGNREQIRNYQLSQGFETLPREVSARGWTSIGDKTIYLIDPSPETFLHEMIHAATFETVAAHYEGQDTGAKEAIERLEVLMGQFLELDQMDLPESYIAASAAIRQAPSKAVALNEYMAWALANRDLVEIQKKTLVDSLVQLGKNALQAIKALIFGKQNAPKVGDDMFSNLLFNTAIVAAVQPSIATMGRDVNLLQSAQYGDNFRLSQLEQKFDRLFSEFLNTGDELTETLRLESLKSPIMRSLDLAELAQARGFTMTMQEHSLFERVVTALATEAELDPNALTQMDQLFRHAMKELTVEHFIRETAPDQEAERFYAQEKLNFLLGNYGTITDAKGRSSLVPVFMGLALVNDGFREVLRTLPVPKSQKNQEGTLDASLENLGNRAMDSLAHRMSGQDNAKNLTDAIDRLSAQTARTAQDRKSFVETLVGPVNTITNAANDAVVGRIDALSKSISASADRVKRNSQSKSVKAVAQAVSLAAKVATEAGAAEAAEGVLAGMNRIKGFQTFRELISDIIGRVGSSADVYDMIKGVRSMVAQVRQQFREHLPTVIADKFTRKLSKDEWSTLHLAMGKTDLASLAQHFSNAEVLELASNPAKRQEAIATLETYLRGADQAHWGRVQSKAQQLATYMLHGRAGTNLLRNAETVSLLLNEQGVSARRAAPDQTYIAGVDQLVSLYALEGLEDGAKGVLSSLVQEQGVGMDFTLAQLVGARKEEMNKAGQGLARLNHYKGYIPSLNQQGVSLVVADDSEKSALLEKSYKRLGDYKGSSVERSGVSRGYYFAPVSGRTAFNQGIMQNVRATASGVDAATGYTDGTLTAGRISHPGQVNQITRRLAREGKTSENLMPVFSESGEVVAYERSVDPMQLGRLNSDTHIAKMIGVWKGRQVEEAKALIVNQRLVDALHDMYREDIKKSSGNRKQYVDLTDSSTFGDDPVVRDALRLMDPAVREYARSRFGNGFFVRRDMLNDVLGYRNASIGDAWTGTTRWSPETVEQVKNIAVAAMGNAAYKTLVNAESGIQNLVKDVKSLIVVKSVVVPFGNFMSNMVHLTMRGIPLADIARAIPRKTAEVNAYTKSQLRKLEAEAELWAAQGSKDIVRERKLKAEIQAIDDSHKRLSIWPLIQAGEFTSISDAGISRDEILLSEGRLQAYMERLADRLPNSVRAAGRYALVTKDTALFQGLQAAVQYGDFLAKAILYDDLTKRKKQSAEYALGRVTEEFVNYDRLPGRTRGYVEDMGLLWFYHFKLRSAKVALSVLRNNPVQALLANFLPIPNVLGPIGTPLGDNVFSKAWEGTLGYSVGPGMALRAPTLNPWVNLAY